MKSLPLVSVFKKTLPMVQIVAWAVLGIYIFSALFFLFRIYLTNPGSEQILLPDFSWMNGLIEIQPSNTNVSGSENFLLTNNFIDQPKSENLFFSGAVAYLWKFFQTGFVIFVLQKLNNFFKEIDAKKFFTSRNVQQLQQVSWALLILSGLKILFLGTLDLSWLFFASLVFIFAEIFAHGVELQTDHDLTL